MSREREGPAWGGPRGGWCVVVLVLVWVCVRAVCLCQTEED